MSCLHAFPLVGHDQTSTPPDLAMPTVADLAARTGLYAAGPSNTTTAAATASGPVPAHAWYKGGLATPAVHAQSISTNGEVVDGLYRVAESVAAQGGAFDTAPRRLLESMAKGENSGCVRLTLLERGAYDGLDGATPAPPVSVLEINTKYCSSCNAYYCCNELIDRTIRGVIAPL